MKTLSLFIFAILLVLGMDAWAQPPARGMVRIACSYRVNEVAVGSATPQIISFNPYEDGSKTLYKTEGIAVTVATSRTKSGLPTVVISATVREKYVSVNGTREVSRLLYNDGTDYVQVVCGQN